MRCFDFTSKTMTRPSLLDRFDELRAHKCFPVSRKSRSYTRLA